MHNSDLRNYAASKGVKLWEIAEKLGINDGNLSRKLRRELSDDEKARCFKLIDEIAAAKY